MTDVRPDDVPRSPTGRVPNWVIDEAQGRAPRDLVPFRASTPTAWSAPRKPRRSGTAMRVVLTLVVVVGLLAVSRQVGGRNLLGGGGTATTLGRRDAPKPGHEEARHPLGTPQPVVIPSHAFGFIAHQDDGKTPVTWSPCRPVHYVVRPENAPLDGPQLLADAFAQLSTATGLRFVDDGSTTEAPTTDRRPYQKQRYGDRWAPVLVTWASDREVPDFGVDIVGEAGPMGVRTPSGDLAFVSGTVALDAEALTAMIQRHQEGRARLVILHELGHLAGLAHVNDPSQVMFPRTGLDASTYQPGDLAGLHTLGSGPCQPDI